MTTVEPAERAAAPDTRAEAARERLAARRAVAALAGVSLLYVVAQLVLFSPGRAFSWDEIVYLAQTAPGELAMDWGPQRARGIVLLVAPVAALHPPVQLVRWYLIAVSGAGLFLAFRPWLRTVGPAGVAGAAVFASSWLGLYFGMEVFPNLPAAFATVATAGSMVDFVRTGRRRSLLGMGVGIALVALFRPSDSVWVAAALLIAAAAAVFIASSVDTEGPRAGSTEDRKVLAEKVRRVVQMGLALAVGGVVGWGPWLIEMSLRYGGPLQALAAAKAESASGRPRDDIDQYLNLVEGPVRLIVTDPTLTHRALAGLVVVGLVLLAGVLHRRHRTAAAVAAAGMAGGLVPYIVLHTGVNLRYLLPAWGLACVVAGIGATALWTSARRIWVAKQLRWAALGLLVVIALVWSVTNGVIARRNAYLAEIEQKGMYLVADEVADRADGRPCAFVTEFGFPQIAWATECIGLEMDVYGETGQCPGATHSIAGLARRGYAIFAMARSPLPDDLMISTWPKERMRVRGYGPWRIYVPTPEQLEKGPLPRAPREGEHSVPCPLSRAPIAEEIRPLRIGPRLPDDETIRWRNRRSDLMQEGS